MRYHRSVEENIGNVIYIFLEGKSVEQDTKPRGIKLKAQIALHKN